MSSGDLRLRLLVRRHAVPDVRLVWPCDLSDDLTIANLLNQINDVIPLESTEWGLEDYAVELADSSGGSFECLHFQLVSRTLKTDDQVIVRPLLTGDLKRRKLSGRHQISVGGKHLVDGVAFGRPWLRTPRDRPMIEIPPRKRARLIYNVGDDEDEEEDEDDEEEPEQEEDEEEEDEYGDDEYDEDINEDELKGLESDEKKQSLPEDEEEEEEEAYNGISDAESVEEISTNDQGQESHTRLLTYPDNTDDVVEELQLLRRDKNEYEQNGSSANIDAARSRLLPSLDCVLALRLAFPLLSADHISIEFVQQKMDVRDTYNALSKANHALFTFDEMMDKAVTGILEPFSSDSEDEPERRAIPTPKRPLIEEVDSTDFIPIKRQKPLVQEVEDHLSSDSETSSSDISSSSDDVEMDSDSDSNSDSDSEAESESGLAKVIGSIQKPTVVEKPLIQDDEDSDSDSNSQSDSDAESNSNSNSNSDESDFGDSSDSNTESTEASTSDDDSSSAVSEEPTRVERDVVVDKPDSNIKAIEPKNSIPTLVAPGEGSSKTYKRNARRKLAKKFKKLGSMKEIQEKEGNTSQILDQELAARKLALLNSIQSPQATKDTIQSEKETIAIETATANTAEAPEQPKSPKPRVRMDLGAGKRLLFGALGIKPPKSKADEDKIREKMMKDVKPLKNARLIEEVPETDDTVHQEPEEPEDAWKDKVVYRAVECCHEGVELSEPPFPFVQRWDPQQQFRSNKKRKRKSNTDYYEEAQHHDQTHELSTIPQDDYYTEPTEPEQVETLNYDDPPLGSQMIDTDDLPPLPTDLFTLQPLSNGAAKPGMVITWKELTMSKATNWQPQMIDVTGLVLSEDKVEGLRVLLAKRDRERNEKEYDDETGERIYDRFEAPDLDEMDGDDMPEDDGNRTVAWADMMEPRIVQREPESNVHSAAAAAAAAAASREPENHISMNGGGTESPSLQSAQQVPYLDSAFNSLTSGSWSAIGIEPVPVTAALAAATADGNSEQRDTDKIVPSSIAEVDDAIEEQLQLRKARSISLGHMEDIIPESLVVKQVLPTLPENHEQKQRSENSSPFPSVQEIYSTAVASRSSQSPSKSLSASAPDLELQEQQQTDADYEKAMRQFDDGDGSEPESLPKVLFPNATQPAPVITHGKSGISPKAAPAPHPRSTPDRKAKRKSKKQPLQQSKFEIPDGTQIITLDSSPVPSRPVSSRGKATASAARSKSNSTLGVEEANVEGVKARESRAGNKSAASASSPTPTGRLRRRTSAVGSV